MTKAELLQNIDLMRSEVEWEYPMDYAATLDVCEQLVKEHYEEDNMSEYTELADKLKEYSYNRKGEIAKLTYDAAVAIGVLEGRVKVLERQLKA